MAASAVVAAPGSAPPCEHAVRRRLAFQHPHYGANNAFSSPAHSPSFTAPRSVNNFNPTRANYGNIGSGNIGNRTVNNFNSGRPGNINTNINHNVARPTNIGNVGNVNRIGNTNIGGNRTVVNNNASDQPELQWREPCVCEQRAPELQ